MRYWERPGFEAMRRTWYGRLAEAGFKDVEMLAGPGKDEWLRPETYASADDVAAGQEVAAVDGEALEDDGLWRDMPAPARVFWALVAQQGWAVEPAARIAGMGRSGPARKAAHVLAEEIRRRVLEVTR